MNNLLNLTIVLATILPCWWLAEKIDLWAHRRDMRSGSWSRYHQDLC